MDLHAADSLYMCVAAAVLQLPLVAFLRTRVSWLFVVAQAKTLASAGGDMSCRGSQALEQSAHGGGGQQELPASQNGAAHPQERSAPVNRMERVLSGVVRHIVGANHDH